MTATSTWSSASWVSGSDVCIPARIRIHLGEIIHQLSLAAALTLVSYPSGRSKAAWNPIDTGLHTFEKWLGDSGW